MNESKVFADGFSFKSPSDKAPDFILGSLSVNVMKAIAWLQANANERGWVNLSIKRSKNGTEYIERDDWKPTKVEGGWKPKPKEEEYDDGIPF